ncbi:leucine-rich repeat-containing protein 59-like [Limulus polyphemus]|uniref:Leucine-rich repeat-containing protein 59-like n=1 Tax=Limulus polyphemus TaxID=6850 RepID=A0ABM1BN12_LIMPO|nr:leucine-rich repeat-containing protein 59-like [Limulus polyphemus]
MSTSTINLKDKLDGHELDLSLNELSEVPVKELAALPKATHIDLSCNKISSLPSNFATLNHIIRLDLSKNDLKELPHNIGNMTRLQHLDLYGNKLTMLPLTFCRLKNLKWLDLKNNPLEPKLKVVAGDCLDEKQCQQCAKKVVAFMQSIESDLEREKQKRLKEEREREAAKKAAEEKEQERQRKLKKAEKERRKAEQKAQKERIRMQQLEKDLEKEFIDDKQTNGIPPKEEKKKEKGSCLRSFLVTVSLLILSVTGYFIVLCVYMGHKIRSTDDLIYAAEDVWYFSKSKTVLWWLVLTDYCTPLWETSQHVARSTWSVLQNYSTYTWEACGVYTDALKNVLLSGIGKIYEFFREK